MSINGAPFFDLAKRADFSGFASDAGPIGAYGAIIGLTLGANQVRFKVGSSSYGPYTLTLTSPSPQSMIDELTGTTGDSLLHTDRHPYFCTSK